MGNMIKLATEMSEEEKRSNRKKKIGAGAVSAAALIGGGLLLKKKHGKGAVDPGPAKMLSHQNLSSNTHYTKQR